MTKMEIFNVVVIAFVFLLGATRSSASHKLVDCRFDAIYQFGESLSDTGNSILEAPEIGRYPYGISKNATGRFSDGLLMIDYIAQPVGPPLLDPYEKQSQGANFVEGVNFAVAGVTALDVTFLATLNINLAQYKIKSTLNLQLGWFDTFLNFLRGQDEEAKEALVPNIINVIINAAETLIEHGAVRIVGPETFPFGCSPAYLQSMKFKSPSQDEYASLQDEYGCVKAYNDFIVYHNEELKKAVTNLRKKYPTLHIVYGDLYNAYLHVHKDSEKLGFRELTKACCGGGGEFNAMVSCGKEKHTVCENPNEYIRSWDGIHLTQQTYKYMAEKLIHNIFPQLGCEKK